MDIVVLEFDHRGDKIDDVSAYANRGRSWALVSAEIAKCDVRCANCHRRRTAEGTAARRYRRSARGVRRPVIQLDLASAFETRTCRVCEQPKTLTHFPFRSIASRTRRWICLLCQRTVTNSWYSRRVGREVRVIRRRTAPTRAELANLVFGYLTEHPCVDCGELDPIVLDFDHARDKSANVSDLVASRASIEDVRKEIEKCAVRCANCHRRRTVFQLKGYRSLMSATREGLEPSALTFVV